MNDKPHVSHLSAPAMVEIGSQSRRMGRPPRNRSGEIEEAILTAAKNLFLAVGYGATTMEAVAQAARVSKRTLYARHPTKDHLMTAVVEHQVKSWSRDATDRAGDLPADFRERMHRYANVFAHAIADPEIQQFDKLISSTASLFPEVARTFYDLGYKYELGFLAAAIAEGTRHDPVPAQRPERVAQQLISMIMGWRKTEETVRTITSEEVTEFAHDAVELLFEGRNGW